ncbi:hypothetical protein ES703_120895 [subsurface metagenome]
MSWILYFIIAIVVIILLSAALKIVQEYERGGVFRLGRFVGLRGPGLVVIIPFIERIRKVDLRVITMDVPQQECMTVDNVTVTVDAVIYFRVVDAADAILKVLDYIKATSHLALSNHAVVTGMNYTGFTGENNFPLGCLRSTTGGHLLQKRLGIAITM